MEYQLEIAVSELNGTFEIGPGTGQGEFWNVLIKMVKKELTAGAVADPAEEAAIRGLLSQISDGDESARQGRSLDVDVHQRH